MFLQTMMQVSKLQQQLSLREEALAHATSLAQGREMDGVHSAHSGDEVRAWGWVCRCVCV